MIRFLIILLLVGAMGIYSVGCKQEDSNVLLDNAVGTPDYNDPALSAPAEDLLYIEFAGSQNDDGTFEYLDSVMFVFEGEHTDFNINAIEHWGHLLSFDSTGLIEHRYTMRDEEGAHNSYSFNGKTGFIVFFGEKITKPGMYVISFEYLGVMVETELAVIG